MQPNFVKLFIYLKKIFKKATKEKRKVVLPIPFPHAKETGKSYFENRHVNKPFRE